MTEVARWKCLNKRGEKGKREGGGKPGEKEAYMERVGEGQRGGEERRGEKKERGEVVAIGGVGCAGTKELGGEA